MPVVINRAETGKTSASTGSKSSAKPKVQADAGDSKGKLIAAISAGVVLLVVVIFFVVQSFGGGGGGANPGVSAGPGESDREEVAQGTGAAGGAQTQNGVSRYSPGTVIDPEAPSNSAATPGSMQMRQKNDPD